MGRDVAVSIGVKNSSNLVPLPGAITGAKDFAAWADRNEFEVRLLTDENDQVVDGKAIFDVINREISAGGVDRLFIFFAGHGVSLGAEISTPSCGRGRLWIGCIRACENRLLSQPAVGRIDGVDSSRSR